MRIPLGELSMFAVVASLILCRSPLLGRSFKLLWLWMVLTHVYSRCGITALWLELRQYINLVLVQVLLISHLLVVVLDLSVMLFLCGDRHQMDLGSSFQPPIYSANPAKFCGRSFGGPPKNPFIPPFFYKKSNSITLLLHQVWKYPPTNITTKFSPLYCLFLQKSTVRYFTSSGLKAFHDFCKKAKDHRTNFARNDAWADWFNFNDLS